MSRGCRWRTHSKLIYRTDKLRAKGEGGDTSPLIRSSISKARTPSSRARTAAPKNRAVVASLIETCKLDGVDPQAYMADVLVKIVNGHLASKLDDLMPWA